jgi:serine/threonine protein phosphatase 1
MEASMKFTTRIDHYERNTAGRDYIVGDIHGQFDQLADKLAAIGFHRECDRLFCTGDLIDRGRQSHLALGFINAPWFHAVRGNHEETFMEYVAGEIPRHERERYFRGFGGRWVTQHTMDDLQRLSDAMAILPLGIEVETDRGGLVGILHADCPAKNWDELKTIMATGDGMPTSSLLGSPAHHIAAMCVWMRTRAERVQGASTTMAKDADMIGGLRALFVGHTPMPRAIVGGNVHFIDTVQWTLRDDALDWRYESGELTIVDLATLQRMEGRS